MKLYTIYSQSHEKLYNEYFLNTISDEFDIITYTTSQYCESGSFYSQGWDRICYDKVTVFKHACKDNLGGFFVFSDVDVQFFGPIKEDLITELGDYDIACQNDCGDTYCSGFFICRCNDSTLSMFEEIIKSYHREDQHMLNLAIRTMGIKAKFLDPKKYFTVGHETMCPWIGQEFSIPDQILVHHANWTVGIDRKVELLETVRSKYNVRSLATGS